MKNYTIKIGENITRLKADGYSVKVWGGFDFFVNNDVGKTVIASVPPSAVIVDEKYLI